MAENDIDRFIDPDIFRQEFAEQMLQKALILKERKPEVYLEQVKLMKVGAGLESGDIEMAHVSFPGFKEQDFFNLLRELKEIHS